MSLAQEPQSQPANLQLRLYSARPRPNVQHLLGALVLQTVARQWALARRGLARDAGLLEHLASSLCRETSDFRPQDFLRREPLRASSPRRAQRGTVGKRRKNENRSGSSSKQVDSRHLASSVKRAAPACLARRDVTARTCAGLSVWCAPTRSLPRQRLPASVGLIDADLVFLRCVRVCRRDIRDQRQGCQVAERTACGPGIQARGQLRQLFQ